MKIELMIIMAGLFLSISSQALYAEAKHSSPENLAIEKSAHDTMTNSCSWWDDRCATK